jgi:putative GTP pyrophosphokinase
MSIFVPPRFTKSRVRAAGKRIVRGIPNEEDESVFNNFRSSHAHLINTFQMNARRHAGKNNATVGQRLKRRNTIIDKLVREPNMPLSAMQDIAGCRIIFNDIASLRHVRMKLRNARFSHERVNDLEKYDYILTPKDTGYRGIHDIYNYSVKDEPGNKWNGLNIEIQFRTTSQHAWATAVEIADLITKNRIKFNDALDEYLLFFQLSSEIIARQSEGLTSCRPNLSNSRLISEFQEQEENLNLLRRLKGLKGASRKLKIRKNTILIFKSGNDDGKEEMLETLPFKSINDAMERYAILEKEMGGYADIVLVRGEDERSIRDTFKNYFTDAQDFISILEAGIAQLK